jgi:hypothetical protein
MTSVKMAAFTAMVRNLALIAITTKWSVLMNLDDMRLALGDIEFLDYKFEVVEKNGLYFLLASYEEADIVTGELEIQKTRKWLLSQHMTLSEFVQTAFKLAITSMEHRTRENFKYKGKRVFGPHFDVDALWEICKEKKFDYRGKMEEQ